MTANNSFKSLLMGAGRAALGWFVSIGLAVLFFRARFAWLPSWLQCTVTVCLFALAVVAVLLSLYLTFISPIVGFVRAWRNGNGIRVTLVAAVGFLVAACLVEFCHWSRVPEYDSVSPDGRYKIVAYVTNLDLGYFIPGGPGDGGSHPAKVELVEVSSGRVIATGRVDWLMNVADTQWWTNEVRVSRGDGGVTFALPEEGNGAICQRNAENMLKTDTKAEGASWE